MNDMKLERLVLVIGQSFQKRERIQIIRKQFGFVLLLMSIFVVGGCSDKTIVNGNVEVIPIDFDKYEEVTMSDIVSRIEVVILEGVSDSYLSGCDILSVKNNCFYIERDQAVFVFDSIGKFKYSTKTRQGRGHNEYYSFNGHYITKGGDIGLVQHDGKVLKYDSLLNFSERYSIPLKNVPYYIDIMSVSDDILAASNSTTGDSILWNFYSISRKKIVGSYCMSGVRNRGIYFGGTNHYLVNENQVLYRINDNGYSLFRLNIDDFSFTEAYKYDLGGYAFNFSDVDESEDMSSFISNNYQKYVILMDLKMNNKYLISRIGYLPVEGLVKGDTRLSFYSLENGKQRLINQKFKKDKFISSIDFLNDSTIYSFYNYRSYEGIDYFYEDSLLDEDSRKRLKDVDDDTNALIFKYYLRDDIL